MEHATRNLFDNIGESDIDNNVLIKRYQNRKLYDTKQSCYVTLEEIADMIKEGLSPSVIDNKTRNDITRYVLLQAIYQAERKKIDLDKDSAPTLEQLKERIVNE